MFGLGLPELIVIFVIALVVFGPKKLPDLGKSIGRAMAEFKKAQQEFQDSVQAEMKEVEKTTNLEELKKLGTLDGLSAYKGADEVKPVEAQDGREKDRPECLKKSRSRKRTRGRPGMAEDELRMSFWSHLSELRKRIVYAAVAIGIGFIVCFNYSEQILGLLAAAYELNDVVSRIVSLPAF